MIQWEEVLGDLAQPDYEIMARPRSGVSSSSVYLVRAGPDRRLFAVKHGRGLRAQLHNRGVLAPYLEEYLPRVVRYVDLIGGDAAMVLEAPTTYSFHDAVTQGRLSDKGSLGIFDRVMEKFLLMWGESQIPFSTPEIIGSMPRRPRERPKRIRHYLESVVLDSCPLTELMSRPLVVNGRHCACLGEILDKMEAVQDPKVAVICHGDPNADNLLVHPGEEKWWLIDWEWVGLSDWRLSLSQFVAWWFANAIYQRNEPEIVINKNRVELIFCVRLPSVCIELAQRALVAGQSFAERHDRVLMESLVKDTEWKEAVKKYLIQHFLGDLRFLLARDRQSYTIPLLGLAALLDAMEIEQWMELFDADGETTSVDVSYRTTTPPRS